MTAGLVILQGLLTLLFPRYSRSTPEALQNSAPQNSGETNPPACQGKVLPTRTHGRTRQTEKSPGPRSMAAGAQHTRMPSPGRHSPHAAPAPAAARAGGGRAPPEPRGRRRYLRGRGTPAQPGPARERPRRRHSAPAGRAGAGRARRERDTELRNYGGNGVFWVGREL